MMTLKQLKKGAPQCSNHAELSALAIVIADGCWRLPERERRRLQGCVRTLGFLTTSIEKLIQHFEPKKLV